MKKMSKDGHIAHAFTNNTQISKAQKAQSVKHHPLVSRVAKANNIQDKLKEFFGINNLILI